MSRVYYPQVRAIITAILDGVGDEDDIKVTRIPCVPKSFTVHKTKYDEPDSFEMSLDGRDLPVDPVIIKGAQVEIYLFNGDGLDEIPRLLDRASGDLAWSDDAAGGDKFVEFRRRFLGPGAKPLIIGLVTDIEESCGRDGVWLSLSGEDYTGFLKARQWPPLDGGRARPIPVGKRLDETMRGVLDLVDETGNLKVEVRGASASELPIVEKQGVGGKHGIPVESSTSSWTVLEDLAHRHGYVVFMDGLSVVLSTPQHLHGESDPNIRTLTWGHNIEQYSLKRHMSKEAAPAVVVRYRDAATGRTAEVEWPSGGNLKRKPRKEVPSKKTKKRTQTVKLSGDYVVVPDMGAGTAEAALRSAQAYYSATALGERSASVSTHDLADTGGRSLLDLAAGDAMRLDVDTFSRDMVRDPQLTNARKIELLQERGFGRTVAELVVDHMDRIEAFKRPMRVREASFSMDDSGAVEISMELSDYIRVPDSETKKQRANDSTRDADGARIGVLK